MTVLVAELPHPQPKLDAPAVATNAFELVTTIQEAAFKTTPIVPGPAITIETGEGTNTIPSPPVMMPATATPRNPTIGLVSSHKYKYLTLFSIFLFLSPNIYISCGGSPQVRTTSDWSLSSEPIDYSGTSGPISDDGGVVSDIDIDKKNYT